MKTSDNTKQHHISRNGIIGIFALAGLFACGFIIGMTMGDKSNALQPVAALQTNDVQIDEMSSCEVIEQTLLEGICGKTDSIDCLNNDIHYYETLVKYGCPENADKYKELIYRNMALVTALNEAASGDRMQKTCELIENELNMQVNNVGDHIERAKIYANLSERGCPENSDKYTDLARQELELARAVEDDNFNESETVEVVETYKRLEMQAAAEEVFEKVKKLTNPAIDFILQVEKIINE